MELISTEKHDKDLRKVPLLTFGGYTPLASGAQMTLCICTWKRTGRASAMIRSASSRLVSGVWPSGTFLSDLSCCSAVNGATHENRTGQISVSLCSAIVALAHS